MPINPNIAMSFKPVEIQQADPLRDYAAIAQIQQARNQNALAQLQMREAEASAQERNMLRQLNPSASDYEAQLFRVNPSLGIQYRKERTAAEASQAARDKSLAESAAARQKLLGQAQRDISQRPSDANITAFAEDFLASSLFTPEEKNRISTLQNTLLAMPFDQRSAYLASQGATAGEMKPSVQQVNRLGQTDILQVPAYGGAPTTVGAYADVPLPKAVEEQKARIALAGRAPVQPVAPTITQIVDPTDPNKMITVDARRYQGGGAGSIGVVGVSGKEPGAALRENKIEAGKTQLADDLDNLRASFQTLDKLKAVPSTERGALSNLASAAAATRTGQLAGQAFATEAQVERDVINSARSRLVNSIKNATGMSAQQLNSNVELQTMLKSISDPGQSFQSAMRIIDDIENAYVKGAGLKKKAAPAAAAPAAATVPALPSGFTLDKQ